MWILFSLLAALATAIVIILSKVGIKDLDSGVAFAIQSVMILIVSWSIVIGRGQLAELARIERRVWVYLILAGIVTCLSSLLSFRALKLGDAARTSSLDKVSLVFSMILAIVFLKEKVNWQVILGAALMAIGAILIAVARK